MRILPGTTCLLLVTALAVPALAAPRDPFRSVFHGASVRQPASLLESFDVAEFRLEGVVSGTFSPCALVIAPTGEGIIVRVGAPIGRRGGRVTRITNDEIVVTETSRTMDGVARVEEVALRVGATP